MSKNKKQGGKMSVKNLAEQETPFDPVPYETTDVCTSITLLSCPEVEIVVRALNILAKYADTKDLNVVFLYKNGIVPKLLELIVYSDLRILRFVLKLLGQITAIVPEAARHLSMENQKETIKQINHLFMTVRDPIVKEFSSELLSHAVKSTLMASSLLEMGTIATIFDVLKTNEDPDTQLNTLVHFNNILKAPEASYVLPLSVEFSARTILCHMKSKIPEIRNAALEVIETLTNWKCGTMQQLLREAHIVEAFLQIILNKDLKVLHKRSFSVILVCLESLETATYFINSLEFIEFCEWAKTCEKKFMPQTATILTSLTRRPELLQVLFDFSVEDSILSFFRTENELVFHKICEGVSNMSTHRFCCKKIVTPIVIECLIRMLLRNNVTIIPYHEIALKTLCLLMKRDVRTVHFIVDSRGLEPIIKSLLRDKNEYTEEGISTLMEILYIFASKVQYRKIIMNSEIYEMLLDRFDDPSEYSQKALVILDQYVPISEYRKYFIEFDGPNIVMRKITSTTIEQELINVLLFLQRNFLYKNIGMAFLFKGCVQLLEEISDEIKKSVPLLGHLLNMMYDLYLPLKFHKLGRLEITDHLTSRFYLIHGIWTQDFPFLEILEELKVVPIGLIYVVDFTADVDELTKVTRVVPPRGLLSNSLRQTSPSLHSISETTSEDQNEPFTNTITCRVPPPVNYGFISEDPYLPQYVEKLKSLLYHTKKYILCFSHQVKLVAKFVCDVLSGPQEAGACVINNHCMEIHLATLKEKLGTSIIPIGYLRYGLYCERALLFKALAEKVGIPTTLVRGQNVERNNALYWNEIPIMNEEPYLNVDDEQKTYLTYAVVDLMYNVGNFMLVGSFEANKYCGVTRK